LALPLAIVEPMKLLAVVVFGAGHWMTGSFVMICAYALSILLVERLFKLVKPKLLKLAWFAAIWAWFVETRHKLLGWVRTTRIGRKAACARRTLKRSRGRSGTPGIVRNR
jgi:hypothetical protein